MRIVWVIWSPPSLSELTPIKFYIELTHLGSEIFIKGFTFIMHYLTFNLNMEKYINILWWIFSVFFDVVINVSLYWCGHLRLEFTYRKLTKVEDYWTKVCHFWQTFLFLYFWQHDTPLLRVDTRLIEYISIWTNVWCW